jgi:hypothetical protein
MPNSGAYFLNVRLPRGFLRAETLALAEFDDPFLHTLAFAV